MRVLAALLAMSVLVMPLCLALPVQADGAPDAGAQGAAASALAPESLRPGVRVRISDIASLSNMASRQLVGYGLVIGLNGSGDNARGAPFTAQSIKSMLDRLGVNVPTGALQARNVAAVVVTAELPADANLGTRIDVTASSLGDAKSLAGGMLVLTPLMGGDGKIYAVAQGPVTVGGFEANGASEQLTAGVPTTGRLPDGAMVQRLPEGGQRDDRYAALELKNAGFGLSVRVADRINQHSLQRFGVDAAREKDARTIILRRPQNVSLSRFLAEIGALEVEAEERAVVVIDERSGTIVIGQNVRVSKVAVTHGNLTVRVTETPAVSQPNPFANGATVVTSETGIDANEPPGQLELINGNSLHSLVRGLNQMGLRPKGIIAILQAIKSAGALHAELVVQ
jgi:flagellar P-ring protein precursor FlgI